MADQPSAPASTGNTVLDSIQNFFKNGLNLNIAGQLPLEGLLTALLNYAATYRASMSQQSRDAVDAIFVQQLQDVQYLWRKLFVDAGVLPPELPKTLTPSK